MKYGDFMIGNMMATLFMSFFMLSSTSGDTCSEKPVIENIPIEYIHEIGDEKPNYKNGLVARSSCTNQDLSNKIEVGESFVNLNEEGDSNFVILTVADPLNKAITNIHVPVKVYYDITAPIIEGYQDFTIEVNYNSINYLEHVTITDNKDEAIGEALAVDDSLVDLTQVGEYDLMYYATDASGNEVNVTVKVHVVDTIKPVVEGATDLIFEVGTNLTPELLFQDLTITDNSEGNISKDVKLDEVNIQKLGNYSFTYIIKDESNNTVEITKRIVVVDTTKPTIELKKEIKHLLNKQNLDYSEFVTVSDNYNQLTFDDLQVFDEYVDLTKPGTYYVHFFVSDRSGNYTVLTAPVVVYDDDIPVIKNVKEIDIPVSTNGEVEIDYFKDIEVIDETDGDLLSQLVVYTHNVQLDKVGKYKIFYLVYDSSHNLAQVETYVTVRDQNKPYFVGLTNFTIEVFSENVNLLDGITALDDHDGDLTDLIEVTHEIDFNVLGSYEVTYKVIDHSDNVTEQVITIQIVDTKKPELINIHDLEVKIGDTIDIKKDIQAIDNYDGDITSRIIIKGDYDLTIVGEYQVKVEVMDSSGNIQFAFMNIKVINDTTVEGSSNSPVIDEKVLYIVGLMGAIILLGLGTRFIIKRR